MHDTIHAAHTRSVCEFIECKMSQGSGRNLFTALLQSRVTAWHAVKHANVNYREMMRDRKLLWSLGERKLGCTGEQTCFK